MLEGLELGWPEMVCYLLGWLESGKRGCLASLDWPESYLVVKILAGVKYLAGGRSLIEG